MRKTSFSKKRWLFLGCISLLVIFCGLVFSLIRVRVQSALGPIHITDARIAVTIDDQGTPPPSVSAIRPDQPRIYCFIAISAPKPVVVGARWFHEEQLIFEDQALVETWRAFYIQPLPGEKFSEGEYRVEILLQKMVIKTLYFSVTR